MSSSKVVKSETKTSEHIVRYAVKTVQALQSTPKGGGAVLPPERQGYEAGFIAGERAGRQAGLQQMEAGLQTIKRLLDELTSVKAHYAETIEGDIVTLALAIARRILKEEIKTRPGWLTDRIKEAAHKLGKTDALTIRLHPKELERLRSAHPEAAEIMDGAANVLWEPDTTLKLGECVVSNQDRIIDVRIDSQLHVISGKLEQTSLKEAA